MKRGSSAGSLTGLFGRFQTIIILLVVSVLGVTAAAFMIFTGREVTRSTLEQGDAEARSIQRVILRNLEGHKVDLDFFKSYAEQQYRQRLKDVVALAVSQVDYFHGLQEKAMLTEEQAKAAALDAVQGLRYGKNDYFFIYDRNIVAIAHPDPAIRGRDMSAVREAGGKTVAVMWEMARDRPDGFMRIWWTRLGDAEPVPKLVYFRHYPNWDWMIGTGIYIDDIDRDVEKKMAEIMDVLKQAFGQVRVAETGYFSLIDGKGNVLIHPSLKDGGPSRPPGTTVPEIALEDLAAASERPDTPLKYLWNKPDSPGEYQYLKYSHVEHFAPFDWYIASSVYQDEMERPAEKIMKRQTIFVGILLLVSLVCVCWLVSRVTSPLARLARHSAKLQERDFSLSEEDRKELDDIRFPREVGHLARTLRDMEERLDAYLKHLEETTTARERMESELRIARDIQMSMLPDRQNVLQGQPGIDLDAVLEPAREVGGDLYDFFMVGPDRLCFLVGDVSGKGVPAALFMARSKAILRSAACRTGATPDAILAVANRELGDGNDLMMFITVALGILDLRTGELSLSNAGHVPPVRLDRDGRCEWIELPPGQPLGLVEDACYATRCLVMKPGDGLVLVTDGVTEAQNGKAEFYPEDRLLDSLRGADVARDAHRIVGAVLGDVQAFASGTPQYDDIAVLCLRYPGGRFFARTLRLEPEGAASRIARVLGEAGAFMEASGLSRETAFDLRGVLEELFSNVLHHGGGPGEGGVEASLHLVVEEGMLRVTVADCGPPSNPLALAEEGPGRTGRKPGGAGLHLLRRLVDKFDYRRLNDRNIVRMMKRIG